MKSILPAAMLACLSTSCVTYTKIKDEPREQVRFANSRAAQIFYDAYVAINSPRGHGEITVGIVLPTPYYEKSTENIRFNKAVRLADSNHDHVISVEEAQSYAEEVKPEDKKVSAPVASR